MTKEETAKKEKKLITKIKILNDGTAYIEYKSSDDLGTGDVKRSGTEKVTEEFSEKFQNTVEGFLGCVPTLSKDKKDIVMNAIKFDYGKTDKLQNVLYSVKYHFNKADNAVINISTPNLPIYREEFDEKTFCVNGVHEALLYELLDLAKKYLAGDTRTKQMKLEVVND